MDDDPRHYMDYTGTGNSLNMRHPHVLQLIMDSLRYWVTEMHVDGFRFDLASTLARELHDVDRLSAFFDLIQQDPVVSQVKLIAEPWDIGEGGYQVGNFPPLWSEWNGRYRDTIRDFWRGEPATLAEFGYRFTGSSDLYQADTRRPTASINFVTAHDGFTLRDLVSYNDKHNEANGEDNRDGESHNRSWNCGVEGDDRRHGDPRPAGPPAAQHRRPPCCCRRACRCCSAATSSAAPSTATTTPTARTTSCPGSTGTTSTRSSSRGVSQVTRLRREHPVFRRRRWFQGRKIRGIEDLAWFRFDGGEMGEEDWETGYAKKRGRVPERADRSRRPTPMVAGSSTTASSSCSTRASSGCPGRCPAAPGRGSGSSSWTPTSSTSPARRCRPAARSTWRPGRWSSCAHRSRPT